MGFIEDYRFLSCTYSQFIYALALYEQISKIWRIFPRFFLNPRTGILIYEWIPFFFANMEFNFFLFIQVHCLPFLSPQHFISTIYYLLIRDIMNTSKSFSFQIYVGNQHTYVQSTNHSPYVNQNPLIFFYNNLPIIVSYLWPTMHCELSPFMHAL